MVELMYEKWFERQGVAIQATCSVRFEFSETALRTLLQFVVYLVDDEDEDMAAATRVRD